MSNAQKGEQFGEICNIIFLPAKERSGCWLIDGELEWNKISRHMEVKKYTGT
jgi:hypothetical protein